MHLPKRTSLASFGAKVEREDAAVKETQWIIINVDDPFGDRLNEKAHMHIWLLLTLLCVSQSGSVQDMG